MHDGLLAGNIIISSVIAANLHPPGEYQLWSSELLVHWLAGSFIMLCDFSQRTNPIFKKFGLGIQNHKRKKIITFNISTLKILQIVTARL